MENISTIMTLTFAMVLVVFSYIGWTYRTNETSDFHTANRAAPGLRIVSSMFTIVGASEFLVFTTLVYIFGAYATVFFVGTALGFFTLSYFTSKIRDGVVEHDMHSIPDLAAKSNLGITTVLLSVFCWIFTFILTMIQIIIGGLLIAAITGLEFAYASAGMTACVFLYLFWGGYRALLYTDVVQALIMIIFTGIFLYFTWSSADLIIALSNHGFPSIEQLQSDLLVLLIGGFFAIVGGPEIWQRVLTSKSNEKAANNLKASGLLMLIWGITIIIIALFIKDFLPDGQDMNNAFFDYVLGAIPSWLLGIITVLLIASIISTSDTELFTGTVIAHRELIRGINAKEKMNIRTSRVILFAMSVVVFITSLYTQNLVTIYFSLVYLTFITGPVGLALILNRGTERVFTVGIILSGLLLFWIVVEGRIYSFWPLLILIPTSIPLFCKRG